ncbi:MAG: FecR family protein [Bacteroidales bacterium]|nr:FecR family protein [Bacteroidales bacterium]
MKSNKNIDLLNQFLDGKAATQDVRHLLGQLKNNDFENEWMTENWESASDSMNSVVQKRIFEKIKQETSPRTFSIRKHWISIAASVLLLLTTSLSAYLLYHSETQNQVKDMSVAVEKGQKAKVILPDGSSVWMNSGSRITYGKRFNQKERIVKLEGEAFFDVAKNKRAPFVVQSGEFSVEALGTAFDVKAYPEEKLITAVLVRGKVEVGDERNKIRLIPNQCVVYDKSVRSMQKTEVENPNLYTSWMNNQMVFESESFENIAIALERNYNIHFAFESNSLKKYRFTGTIKNTSLESLLQIFSMTSPFTYSIKDSVIYLKENRATMPYYRRITGQ